MYKTNGNVREKAQHKDKRSRLLTVALLRYPKVPTACLDDIVKDTPEVVAKRRWHPIRCADQLLTQLRKLLFSAGARFGVPIRPLFAHHGLGIT